MAQPYGMAGPAAPNTVADERSGGFGPVLSAARYASFRSGQTMNALLNGTHVSLDRGFFTTFAKGIFGWKAIDDEMLKWRSGRSFFRTIPARFGLMRSESWLMTGTSPSLWMLSAKAMDDPSSVSRNVWRLFEKGGYGDPEVVRRELSGFKRTKKAVFEMEDALPDLAGGRVLDPEAASKYSGVLDASEAQLWTRTALRFGEARVSVPAFMHGMEKYGIVPGAKVKHYVMGLLFEPEGYTAEIGEKLIAGISDDAAKSAAKTAATRAGAALGSGMMMAGDDAVAFAARKGIASAALRAAGFGLRLVPYVELGFMVKDAVTLAGRLGGLVFDKVPRYMYRNIVGAASAPMLAPVAAAMPDSPVAANNRQRAIQAIQGSRLNARNAIGREASLMAYHFG